MSILNSFPNADSTFTGRLKWAYTNLQPFETRFISLAIKLEAPPVNNAGDTLFFDAAITPVAGDSTPVDNSFTLQQPVVNSFDPNDISCLEGSAINVSKVGAYVHYLIRFQNMGTDTADNIVAKDTLTNKFNWGTVELVKSSHPCMLRQSRGNQLEFIFQNIQLPAKIQNEAASNGYVLFKVKSKSTLVAGDSLVNQAAIYFDYNAPIVTNKAITKYVSGIAVNLGNDINICGNTALLNAGNTGSTFLWSTGASTQAIAVSISGTYWVRVTNQYGFSASDTIQVTINPLPTVNLGTDIMQCGGTVTLNAGNAGSSYLWSNGATTQSINAAASGTYSVKVTNANGCIGRDTIKVTINPTPVVSLGADAGFCTGNTVVLDAGNAGAAYLWNTGAITRQLAVSLGGQYSVRVTNTTGCAAADTIHLTQRDLPVVQLSLPDTLFASDAPVAALVQPTGGQFTGTGMANGRFDAAAAGQGKHTIRYQYTNAWGCSSQASATIVVLTAVDKMKVYPNPNRGNFTVVAGPALHHGNLTIVTPTGQVVGRLALNAFVQQVRVSLRPGVYCLQLSNNGFTETRRMLVW